MRYLIRFFAWLRCLVLGHAWSTHKSQWRLHTYADGYGFVDRYQRNARCTRSGCRETSVVIVPDAEVPKYIRTKRAPAEPSPQQEIFNG